MVVRRVPGLQVSGATHKILGIHDIMHGGHAVAYCIATPPQQRRGRWDPGNWICSCTGLKPTKRGQLKEVVLDLAAIRRRKMLHERAIVLTIILLTAETRYV